MANRRLLLALLFSLACPAAWAQLPVGDEFQINSYTTNDQWYSAVASDANGNFVVVWQSYGQDGSSGGIFGQRFNASGAPQGAEFQVNSYTTGFQHFPAVAADPNGSFVVVWGSLRQDGSWWGVFGQRFDASGDPQGSEFQVNSYTTGYQSHPAVSLDANGNFVVVWESYEWDPSYVWGVFGQRFNASGIPRGSEFQVNAYTTVRQSYPAVELDPSGNFVVVWGSRFQDGDGQGVFGRRFDASGLPQGGEFQVNSYTTGNQGGGAVAFGANGNFVVVWSSGTQPGYPYGIFGQRFDASGVPQGSEFRASSYTTGRQGQPAVAADANGNFVVVWSSHNQNGSASGVFGQRFDASGVPQAGELQIGNSSSWLLSDPALASAANGNFVVVWSSYFQDKDRFGVFGQRYSVDLIFKDGFE